MSIWVTKSFMPPISEYEKYIRQIYKTGILTNEGPYVLELEEKMRSFLGLKTFIILQTEPLLFS